MKIKKKIVDASPQPARFDPMKTNTTKPPAIADILAKCMELRLTKIHIGYGHKLLPHSLTWKDAPFSLWGNPGIRHKRWPAVWEVARCFPEISAGCGNTGQHQLTHECLPAQTWQLRKGQWVQLP